MTFFKAIATQLNNDNKITTRFYIFTRCPKSAAKVKGMLLKNPHSYQCLKYTLLAAD